ncbi:MAG: enoyl-CoA hydratase/isomerase family protein [Caulobacteraceae bacterium]
MSVEAEAAPVLVEVSGGAAIITINRPSRGNAIDLALAIGLEDALAKCAQTPGLRVITLRGAGRLFCVGGDLAAIDAERENAPAYVGRLLDHLHRALLAIARIGAPVIAGVHGAAAGGGLGLALACDLVLASRSARFLMAYGRVGLTPDASSSYSLPRLIGLRRALDLTLSGRELVAEEALSWGLVSEVAEDDQFEERLAALAAEIAAGPTVALGGAKRLVRSSLCASFEGQLDAEKATLMASLASSDAAEGLAAFSARRKPNFTGG